MWNEENRLQNLLKIFSAAIILVVLAYMGLVGAGHWQIDEYHTIFAYRTYGVDYLWFRLITWSPRPFSETLIYFYSTLVNHLHRSLVTEFLSTLWMGLACSLVIHLWFFKKNQIPWAVRLTFVLLPLYVTLTIAKTGEVFYWPFGAAAYIPSVAAIIIMFGTLSWGNAKNNTALWIGSSMLLAASSEMGAIFICIFFGLLIIFTARENPIASKNRQWAKLLTPAFLIAVLVILDLVLGRVGNSGEAQMNSVAAHNITLAAHATIPEGLVQLFATSGNGPTERPLAAALKLCVLVLYFSLARVYFHANKSLTLLLFSGACIGTIFFTIFAAYYQFGVSCCERHETVREFLSIVALATAGAGYSILSKSYRPRNFHIFMAITSALMLLVPSGAINIKKLHAAYSAYAELVELNQTNWLYTQKPPYRFQVNSPKIAILGELHGIKEGVYKKSLATPSYNQQILEFFAVKEIDFVVRPSAQPISSIDSAFGLEQLRKGLPSLPCTFDRAYVFSTSKNRFMLHVTGWMNIPHAGLNPSATEVVLMTVDRAQAAAYWRAPLYARSDVASHFNRPDMLLSGFNASVPVPEQDVREAYLIAADAHAVAACRLHLPLPTDGTP